MHPRILGTLSMALVAMPALAQQSGTLVGKVTGKNGQGLAGVRVEVSSTVLPQARRISTNAHGEYRLPFLPPGSYQATFFLTGMNPEKRMVKVVLDQTTTLSLALTEAKTAEKVVEIVGEASLVDPSTPELKSAVTSEVFDMLPVGRDFRDLTKLIAGVQYTEDTTRGPAAGGSGQDNVYKFDGVNVNLPLFGTLSAEPASLDIDQMSVIKGGAAATDFNRSSGFTVNSVSKSGTNEFKGSISYRTIPGNWVAKRSLASFTAFEQDTYYFNGNFSGPVIKERLFFYTSYYKPVVTQVNRANLYGYQPELDSRRDEYFAKLTWSPTTDILIHGSLRTSKRTYEHFGIGGQTTAPTASTGGKNTLDIGILEGTWNLTPSSYLGFKFTQFKNRTQDTPDVLAAASAAIGAALDVSVAGLARQGQLTVPTTQTGTTLTPAQVAYNAFVAPYITQYGYPSPTTGLPTGGGIVGGASQFNNQDFYRDSGQITYDVMFGSGVTHELHFGYQQYKDAEDLYRISNGWGSISMPFNSTVPVGLPNAGAPVYFRAAVQQQGLLGVPTIHSEYVSRNFEVNDKITWGKWVFNAGLLMSNDLLYGQGLKENSATLSGFELAAPGHRYKMHEIKWKDTLQPRLGVTWNYTQNDTVYFNYARYVPAASSLPRAASWARNKASTVNVYWGQTGNFLASQVEQSSTGKLFQKGIKPRHTDELLLGSTKDFGKGLSGRLYARYRRSANFWEDTNNNARIDPYFNSPSWVPKAYYIPDLKAQLDQIQGVTTSSQIGYVIAQLDNAFTKYYAVGTELEWRKGRFYLNGSYVWSHYYGNMDQDNTTNNVANDANIFIGSSNIADEKGRQLWDNKYGNLSGDRRHLVKTFGTYQLPWWDASVGFYAIIQSGQPWQAQDHRVYSPPFDGTKGSTSLSDTNRYSEPAGSRRTKTHSQLDVNYTHFVYNTGDYKNVRMEVKLDVFNVFNRQTGYNPQATASSPQFGTPNSTFAPRRAQLAITVKF